MLKNCLNKIIQITYFKHNGLSLVIFILRIIKRLMLFLISINIQV